ncbi:MAG: DUF3098 domain-containing protein [Bacteroidia bacterium]|nr:DUF3098 domain-containing protein [Bacteroidia bacterium]
MSKKVVKTVEDFPFGKENFVIMLTGLAVIFLGFALMTGGGSEDPKIWNPEIFSWRRITLAPILVIAGFVIQVYAILKKSKE